MKKKYITLEEVLKLRETDTKIYCDVDSATYYKSFGDLFCSCSLKDDSIVLIGCAFEKDDGLYILEPEEFKVEKTGLYKTRDGRTAYVSFVGKENAYGIVDGFQTDFHWYKDGSHLMFKEDDLDLVEYVGD